MPPSLSLAEFTSSSSSSSSSSQADDPSLSSIDPTTDSDISINDQSLLNEGTSYTSTETQSPPNGKSHHSPSPPPLLSLHDRFLSLASLASKFEDDGESKILQPHVEERLHWSLDEIEKELRLCDGDTKELMKKIDISSSSSSSSRDTPVNNHSKPTTSTTTSTTTTTTSNITPEPRTNPTNNPPQASTSTTSSLLFRQVDQEYYQSVCADLQNLTTEFEKRRDECLDIQKALTDRQDDFAKELARREERVASLHQILSENSTDIEALCGTVNGLNEWLRQKRARRPKNHLTASARYRTIASIRRQHDMWRHGRLHRGAHDEDDEEEGSDEAGMLFEGIETWFREWKCFEEEFRIRQQARNAGLSAN